MPTWKVEFSLRHGECFSMIMEAGGATRPILEATPGLVVILLLVVSGGIRPEGVAAWMRGKGEAGPAPPGGISNPASPRPAGESGAAPSETTLSAPSAGSPPREEMRAVEVAEGHLRFDGGGTGWWRGRRSRVPEGPAAVAEALPAAPNRAGIDINRATKEELMRLPGIGAVRAEAILAARGKGFASWEAFDRIPGIGPKTIERIRRVGYLSPMGP